MGIEALRHYAATHFYRHLREVNLLEISRETLGEIGRRLAQVLCDPATIDIWWHSRNRQLHLHSDWMKTGDNVDLLRRCLSNPYVEVGYRDHVEQHEFIKAALAHSSNRYNIMSKVAGRVAALWLGNERSMGLLFIVPATIMTKVG